MSNFLTALWASYGPIIMNFGIGITCFLLLIGAGYAVSPIFAFLKNNADKVLGDKIGSRVRDAIGKLELVTKQCIASTQELYKKEIIAAAADGQITNEELKAIQSKIVKQVMDIIKPELATLKKYVCGDMVLEFVTTTVQSYIVEWADSKINNRPFLTAGSKTN